MFKCDKDLLEEHIEELTYDWELASNWKCAEALKKSELIGLLNYMKKQFTIIKDE